MKCESVWRVIDDAFTLLFPVIGYRRWSLLLYLALRHQFHAPTFRSSTQRFTHSATCPGADVVYLPQVAGHLRFCRACESYIEIHYATQEETDTGELPAAVRQWLIRPVDSVVSNLANAIQQIS